MDCFVYELRYSSSHYGNLMNIPIPIAVFSTIFSKEKFDFMQLYKWQLLLFSNQDVQISDVCGITFVPKSGTSEGTF